MIQLRPLQAAYALAAGDTINERVKAHGELPAAMRDEYATWGAAHAALAAAGQPTGLDARKVDPFLDRAAVLPAKVAQLIVDAYADSPVELSQAQLQRLADARVVVAAYDTDLRKLVSIPYVEEWAAVQKLLTALSSDAATQQAMARLGLVAEVEHARALHALYGRALGIGAAAEPTADGALEASWNNAFLDLYVAAHHLGRKQPGLLELFAAPYAEQLGRQVGVNRGPRKPSPEGPTS